MKTPMQKLIDSLKRERMNPSNEWQLGYQKALSNVISEIESMLEKEKEAMVDFAYKFGDEPLSEIPKWYDKQFNTK